MMGYKKLKYFMYLNDLLERSFKASGFRKDELIKDENIILTESDSYMINMKGNGKNFYILHVNIMQDDYGKDYVSLWFVQGYNAEVVGDFFIYKYNFSEDHEEEFINKMVDLLLLNW